MSDLWALALGILCLAVWVAGYKIIGSLRDAQLQGQLDIITKKDRTLDYTGLACMMYKRGRRKKVVARHRENRDYKI